MAVKLNMEKPDRCNPCPLSQTHMRDRGLESGWYCNYGNKPSLTSENVWRKAPEWCPMEETK